MLFFKPKKETADEKSAVILSRPPRYECLVKVGINGYEGQAVLKNISQTGFRMESKTFVEIEAGSTYVMHVMPEITTGVKPFDVTVEIRWMQSSPDKFSLGLMVTDVENRSFQKYVSHLKDNAVKSG
ncbi:MAG: PilZ domain-containing protein [Treponema sp.]|jgi:hypothetical protein|nr:PilZ domain-containing protein [Treponema sp.]